MQYYSVKLRLSGNPMNEIRDVYSAPEILILQYIHGVDAVTEIKKVKQSIINMRDHKDFIKSRYDQALTRRDQSVDKIFGALGQLPTVLPDHLLEANDILDEDDVLAVAKAATKAEKSRYLPKNATEQRRVDSIVPANEVDVNDIME